MQPFAQIQTAIELLEEKSGKPTPTDHFMAKFFKARRYIGSKDKAMVADIVYTVERHTFSLTWLCEKAGFEATPRVLVLLALKLHMNKKVSEIAELFTGERHAPKKLTSSEQKFVGSVYLKSLKEAPMPTQLDIPAWSWPLFQKTFGEDAEKAAKALCGRAPADVRTNTLKTNRDELLKSLQNQGFPLEATKLSPWGLRMEERKSLFNTENFTRGELEIQDEGSQLIALATGAKAGDTLVDFCCGAGGKTTAVGALMENKGVLYACDINERRMKELPKRLSRAGLDNVRKVLLTSEHDKWVKRHKETADIVLIDAPCSGSGTWRRSPDSKLKLTPGNVRNLTETQLSILTSAARLVKKGGTLVYATCSMFTEENSTIVDSFLAENTNFQALDTGEILAEKGCTLPTEAIKGTSIQLAPHSTETDGFFIAALKREG